METYKDSLNTSLLFRNKQLTKQLKNYQRVSTLADCSSAMVLAIGQLIRLHRKPLYGIIESEAEWQNLFAVIDLLYGGCLSEELIMYPLSAQDLKLCYLVRARVGNKAISTLFNITSGSVLKAKQRIKLKLRLSATDSLDWHIQK